MENVLDDRENLSTFLEEAELQQYYELFRDILKITKLSQLKFVVTDDLVQIGLSKPEQRRYKKIYLKYFPKQYISKIKKLLSSSKKNEQYPQGLCSKPLEILPLSESNVKVPTKHIISIEDITINKELGMGQFGVVQQGTWTTGNQRLQVAIKCLGHERMTSNSTEFLKEAAVMHSIEHSNIVRLYGVVLHLDSLMLVTELAPLRSLLECLREISLWANFPVPNLCEFAEQICDGMTYLENKRLIHRDLAARNILVFSKDRVKISDFGLSRALGVGKDYYQTNYSVNLKLPVAWCAPECILYLRFTSSSDVWAFGVCLWEMFTYGFQPWAAFSGQQILEAIDAPNFQRLERPECCPEAYYSTMLECWSHDPNTRPKFKDLGPKIKEIRPEQVQTTVNYLKLEDGRRCNFLEYKSGQIITVLGKENMTKTSLWYGVLPGGACGLFDPKKTKPYIKPEKSISQLPSLSPHPTRNSTRSIRSSLLRSDVKRHTYTGKRSIQRSMISSPQGDVKHTGHVGLDGAYFGDISFLDPAGCPPQVVSSYKPSEDLEQVPLINPNSPSHLSGASCTSPYPLLNSNRHERKNECDEVDLPYDQSRSRSLGRTIYKPITEPSTSTSFLNKVRSATLGRTHKTEDSVGATSKVVEVHEYHEIPDTDTESNAADNVKLENVALPECPGIPKNNADFSQSLLAEMESMFLSLDDSPRDEPGTLAKYFDIDTALRPHTMNKTEKKKNLDTGTMKPMSAHDKKTLDTAVAMANEITTKSMRDFDKDKKVARTSSERSRFHFKFPHLSLHHHASHDANKESVAKQERRNFSDQAKNVPDLNSTFTEESKLAYKSLIELPIPSSSRMSHISKDPIGVPNPRIYPKPVIRRVDSGPHLQTLPPISECDPPPMVHADIRETVISNNVLPLPPRGTKPKLVDKPRHYRKHPLVLPGNHLNEASQSKATPLRLYQNALARPLILLNSKLIIVNSNHVEKEGVDVCDAAGSGKTPTNPFTNTSGHGSVNPFNYFMDRQDIVLHDDACDTENEGMCDKAKGEVDAEEGPLVKDCTDHVSVEDLLEFADQKPCGRQRGIESDEVRIMNKVLKQLVAPEECLNALELSDWNVHHAIKLIRVRTSVGSDVTLEDCGANLAKSIGDTVNASVALVFCKPNEEK